MQKGRREKISKESRHRTFGNEKGKGKEQVISSACKKTELSLCCGEVMGSEKNLIIVSCNEGEGKKGGERCAGCRPKNAGRILMTPRKKKQRRGKSGREGYLREKKRIRDERKREEEGVFSI